MPGTCIPASWVVSIPKKKTMGSQLYPLSSLPVHYVYWACKNIKKCFRSHLYIDILNWSLIVGLLHHLCVASSMVVVMVGCEDLRTLQATYHNLNQSYFHQKQQVFKCKLRQCWTTNCLAIESLTATISTFSSLALARTKCASHPTHVTLMGSRTAFIFSGMHKKLLMATESVSIHCQLI